LADDAPVQGLLHREQLVGFVGGDLVDRHAGPEGHDVANVLFGDNRNHRHAGIHLIVGHPFAFADQRYELGL
jgi:hypothetical protein